MKTLFLLLFLLVPSAAQSQDSNHILYVVPDEDNSKFQIHVMDVVSGDHQEIDQIGSRRSDAGWSPDGRYIYVVDYVDEDSRILRLVEFETGESQIITEQVRVDDCAAYLSWSPDGRFLAYHTEKGTEITLHVLDTRDNQTRRLPDAVTLNAWLFWSPDSRYLAVALEPEGVLIWDLLRDQIMSTLDSYLSISWSPDTRYFAFTPTGEQREIAVFALTSGQTKHYPGSLLGKWSSDGRYLVHSQQENNRNYVFILDTHEEQNFLLEDEYTITNFLGWSPDSRYAAYLNRHPQTQTLHVRDLLTDTTEMLTSVPYIQYLIWSPVENVLAFTSSPDSPKGNSTHLTIVDIGTGSATQFEVRVADVLYDQPLRWSANGQYLAAYTQDGVNIYDHASATLRPVTESIQNVLPPRWSPDGRYLSFYSFTPDKRDIYVIDTNNNLQLQNVTHSPGEDEVFIGWRGSNDNRSLIYCGIG